MGLRVLLSHSISLALDPKPPRTARPCAPLATAGAVAPWLARAK